MKEAIARLQQAMAEHGYITDRATATAAYLAMTLQQAAARSKGRRASARPRSRRCSPRVLDTELIRLQCYEGLDVSTALYEWNYPKQMLHIKLEEGAGRLARRAARRRSSARRSCSSGRCSARSAPGQAAGAARSTRSTARDEEFEAFLLEVLSDFQVTIPELGTSRATHEPYVVLTSNRTRELSDALRRRCLYLWIDYPSLRQGARDHHERRCPASTTQLAGRSSRRSCRRFAGMRLIKTPGVAETLDWAHALVALGRRALDDDRRPRR